MKKLILFIGVLFIGLGVFAQNTVDASDGIRVFYDDLQVNVGRVDFPGVADPTWRAYDHGVGGGIAYTVLGFDVGDYVDFDIQTFHAMKLNSALDMHIHYILPNTTNVGDSIVFQLDVIGAGVGADYSVPIGSPFTGRTVVATDDNVKHRILELGEIPALNTTVSSIYTCRLQRIAPVSGGYSGEVYVKYIDGHYQRDQNGSREEYVK